MGDFSREVLIHELLQRFRAVFQGVRSGFRFHQTAHNLGAAEVGVMMCLGHSKDGVSVKDLASDIGITSGAVTQLVDKLLAKGLVERVEDLVDRRSVHIVLSAQARQGREQMKKEYFAQMSAIFGELSDDDLVQMIALFNKVKLESRPDQLSSEETSQCLN